MRNCLTAGQDMKHGVKTDFLPLVVLSLVWLMVMMITTGWCLKCEKTGLCTCKTRHGGTIDLSPLASNGTARFKDIPGSVKPYVYSWNPCIPFTEGGVCTDVAVCLKDANSSELYNLGFATSAEFFTWPDGNLSLQYMVGGGDGIIKVSSVTLVCDHKEEGKLDVQGKTSMGFYSFRLMSKFACVNH